MGTAGVGACRAGTERCASNGQSWGACTSAVVPASEACGNNTDDDCDGMTDEGCSTMTAPMCAGGPQVEDSAGNYMVLANYDGGDLVILGGTRRAWHLQYRTFTGGTFRVSAGGCCG